MSFSVLLTALVVLPLAVGEREEVQTVCVGKEFRLPVYSTSRIVTFKPDSDEPKRVLLEKTTVKDPRFEWTRDKMLFLREVTHAHQGLYAIKQLSGFTYETLRLRVLDCIKSYYRHYREIFKLSIPENASVLEFSPLGAPKDARTVVLWNRTDPETTNMSRGRLEQGGKVWVADRVTQADQGNYTVRDDQAKVLSFSTLRVQGRSFNITRFTKEALNLPLFLPVPHAHLIFTPSKPSSHQPGSVQLIREGHIINHDLHFRGLISVVNNGTMNEVVITSLNSGHNGVYEIKDSDGNLVSSTVLQMVEKKDRWRALLKSITVPCGLFLSLTSLILFIKRYPKCSLSQIIAGLRGNRRPPVNPPTVNIQDCSQASLQPSDYSHSQQPGTPRKWSQRASPTHNGYSLVTVGTPQSQNREVNRRAAYNSPNHNANIEDASSEEDRISFLVPGASDCLHSSEDCVQFQINKDGGKKQCNKSQDYFATLPLDGDTSGSNSVYTSNKLNFI